MNIKMAIRTNLNVCDMYVQQRYYIGLSKNI